VTAFREGSRRVPAVGKNCVKGGVGFGEVFDDGAHVGEWLNGGEAGDSRDVGIGRRFADAIPFSSSGFLGGRKRISLGPSEAELFFAEE